MEGFSPDKSLTLTDAFQQLSSFEKVNFMKQLNYLAR